MPYTYSYPPLRRIPFKDAHNVRDLGGYPTCDAKLTRFRCFIRSSVPVHYSAEEVDWLYEYGLRTVVDLREADEVKTWPNPYAGYKGVAYYNIPLYNARFAPDGSVEGVDGEALPDYELPWQAYSLMLEQKAGLAGALSAIASGEGMVMFHCSGGKDRTGIVAALLLSAVGVYREDIIADYALTQTYLHSFITRSKDMFPHVKEIFHGALPETMRLLLEHTDRKYGSVLDYIMSIGVKQDTIDAIKAKFVE